MKNGYFFKEVDGCGVGFSFDILKSKDRKGKEDVYDLDLVGLINVFDEVLFMHIFDKRLSVDKILNSFRMSNPEVKFSKEVIK